jgi:fibronectin type 3 domain-containing protein
MVQKPGSRSLRLEELERRLNPCLPVNPGILSPDLAVFPSLQIDSQETSGDPASGPEADGLAFAPLTAIPQLNSLPGAPANLYLDFNGHFEAVWGSFTNITTPVFDTDGDPTTFSNSELSVITAVWRYVTEDFAPFNINVTTVEPPINVPTMRVSIGGDGAWLGVPAGGVAYIDNFTNPFLPDTVYAFSQAVGNSAKNIGDVASHEAGHSFGLQHQSLFDAAGNKLEEYYAGPGDGRAPIMGVSYSASRSLWWNGPSSPGADIIQDDMAVISRFENDFGYRPDDHGNTIAQATELTLSGVDVSGQGVITQTSDKDYFSFVTGEGTISMSVSVATIYANLDTTLDLYDANGTLLLALDPSGSVGASFNLFVAEGTYYLRVGSHGSYGDVGQYTVSGTVIDLGNQMPAPSNLIADVVSTSRIDLAWQDNAGSETSYQVQRSSDGNTWVQIASLGANSESFSDNSVSPGNAYFYRVRALGGPFFSKFSEVVPATMMPDNPTGLQAVAMSSSKITLSWSDSSLENGYLIERTTDGVTWFEAGSAVADQTSFQDTGLSASTAYTYRIRAFNISGFSGFSSSASATTEAGGSSLTKPAKPTDLSAQAPSSEQVQLSWHDNSLNEAGFIIQRSTDGGKTWKKLAKVPANVTSFFDDAVRPGKAYKYRVRAYNSVGKSSYSNVVKIKTPKDDSGIGNGPLAASAEATGGSNESDTFWASLNVGSLDWTDVLDFFQCITRRR